MKAAAVATWVAATAALATLPITARSGRQEGTPLLGLQPFPYDFSQEAIDQVHRIAAEHSTLYVVHRDNGIPWAEALADGPFPPEVQREWADIARRAPAGRPVYLALAPLAEDRESLSPASKGSKMPAALEGAAFDDPAVEKAYLTYAKRAVAAFHPRFLNLGIEAGELAARRPERWRAFAALYGHVRSELRRLHPDLEIGISFSLPTLMIPGVAARVEGLIEASDYVGLSYYPYMSSFYEKYGAAPLPDPPAQWRAPLAWARRHLQKPIAVCETGYATRDVQLPRFGLSMRGSEDLQNRYLSDLLDIARRDDYLFVVWSLPVDLEKFFAKLPSDGRYLIFQNIGLFDQDVHERPAWRTWARAVGGAPDHGASGARDPTSSSTVAIGFTSAADIFVGPGTERLAITEAGAGKGGKAMEWSFDYTADTWRWCARDVTRGTFAGREQLSFWLRSDREGQIFLQVKEKGGETFYTMVSPTRRWQEHSYRFVDLTADPKKKQDGRLNAADVDQILLADSAGAQHGARGSRHLWFADWVVR